MLSIEEERRNLAGAAHDCDEILVGDRAIADLARRQRGVVTTAQLEALGIGRNAIAHRVQHGRLTRVLRGVYQVGPVEAPFAREMAAILATHGVLSHHSAAMTVGLQTTSGRAGPHHGGERRAEPAGAPGPPHRFSKCRSAQRAATHAGGQNAPRPRAADQPRRAGTRRGGGGDPRSRHARRRAAALCAVAIDPQITRSEAERRLQRLIRAAKLPRPVTNIRVAGWEVDAYWPRERLVVEVDGYAYHGNRAAFERDRRKDAALVTAGYTVIRITWRQLQDEPLTVVALLARLIRPA